MQYVGKRKNEKKYNVLNDYVIIQIGRFAWVKNHQYTLKIFKILKDKVTNVKLFLVGDGEKERK
ncbi:glycosyltransferase [Caloramator sp. mosi_1]|nr:glycosyltransferase [Caloramator sp. mosi_1]WDC85908.1 glycosyltransferase [Caloramator sp. mosi_1]